MNTNELGEAIENIIVQDTCLVGTKWKLEGIVDTETNDLKVLEPQDCEECYTLTFMDSSTFNGQSATNFLAGSYIIDYETEKFCFTNVGGTERGEIGHGYIYVELLWKIQSFTTKDTSPRILHLYYNDGKNYLKYKKIGG